MLNPIACFGCKLKNSCVGLSQKKNNLVLVKNNILERDFKSLIRKYSDKKIDFICILEEDIPKKAYQINDNNWLLIDEFSGYILTSKNKLSPKLVSKELIYFDEFIKNS